MGERQKIYIEKKEDRDEMVAVLARNGYTVRQARERKGSSKTVYQWFVEYWREEGRA